MPHVTKFLFQGRLMTMEEAVEVVYAPFKVHTSEAKHRLRRAACRSMIRRSYKYWRYVL